MFQLFNCALGRSSCSQHEVTKFISLWAKLRSFAYRCFFIASLSERPKVHLSIFALLFLRLLRMERMANSSNRKAVYLLDGKAWFPYWTVSSQSRSRSYGLRNQLSSSCRNSLAFSRPRHSWSSSSACPVLPLMSIDLIIAMMYSPRNSAFFARRLESPSPTDSLFKNSKTCSSLRIQIFAR